MKKISLLAVFFVQGLFAQFSPTDLQNVGYLLEDALFYSEKYIVPATDAAVYQASTSWINSAKKKKKWKLTMGIHGNCFVVPRKDRTFKIQNSDFKFLQLEGQEQATVPTALGNNEQYYMSGTISNQLIRFKTPEGINQETVIYPYLNISVGLPLGFELIARTSMITPLKKGEYQVYGYGLKHNLSQYFSSLKSNKINFALAGFYSKEEISFDFLDINTPFGNLGLNKSMNEVDTYNLQFVASKELGNFEILGSFLVNKSQFNYQVGGEKGAIEAVIPVQDVINKMLDKIEKDKINYVGELAFNYHKNRWNVITSIGFGKFINANSGIQYTFN